MEAVAARAPQARAAAALAALVVLAVAVSTIDTLPVGVFYDDALYVILAKALATGHGYHWLNLPGAPPATHFPPGYPLFLAAIWRVFPSFPGNVLAFKAANAALLALASWAMVPFLRRRFGFTPIAAAGLSIIACLGLPLLSLSTLVLSESLFLALLIPLLTLAESVIEGERRTKDLVVLGVLAAIATLVRTHGIALVAGAALALVFRQPGIKGQRDARRVTVAARMKDAVVVVACAAFVMLPWQLWVHARQGLVPEAMRGMYESYASWLARGISGEGAALLWRTPVRTTIDAAGFLATLSTPLTFEWARVVTLVTLGALLIAGLRRAWRTAPVTVLFLTTYAAIIMIWPFAPARFVCGIWPLVMLVFVLGGLEIISWAPRWRVSQTARALALACVLFVAFGHIRYSVRAYREHAWSNVARREAAIIRPSVVWVRAHTHPQDVLMSVAEPTVYLYSGRLALPAMAFTVRDYFGPGTAVERATALRQVLAAYHVDAILVLGDSLRAAAQSMASGAAPELVFRDSLVNGLVFSPVRSSVVVQRSAAQ